MKTTCTLKTLFLLLAATLIMAATSVVAQDEPPLEPDCQCGNLNDPVDFVPEIFRANESYAYFVRPKDTCGCDTPEFELLSITQLLYFDEQQLPATFTVEASLLEAVPDGACDFVPGPALCISPPVTFNVDVPGLFAVTVPTPGCGDFRLGGEYFLSLSYEGNAPGSLAIDADPQPCVEFADFGNGWQDLIQYKMADGKTGGGKAIVFGDIVCKLNGVPIDTQTWGAIKGLFR